MNFLKFVAVLLILVQCAANAASGTVANTPAVVITDSNVPPTTATYVPEIPARAPFYRRFASQVSAFAQSDAAYGALRMLDIRNVATKAFVGFAELFQVFLRYCQDLFNNRILVGKQDAFNASSANDTNSRVSEQNKTLATSNEEESKKLEGETTSILALSVLAIVLFALRHVSALSNAVTSMVSSLCCRTVSAGTNSSFTVEIEDFAFEMSFLEFFAALVADNSDEVADTTITAVPYTETIEYTTQVRGLSVREEMGYEYYCVNSSFEDSTSEEEDDDDFDCFYIDSSCEPSEIEEAEDDNEVENENYSYHGSQYEACDLNTDGDDNSDDSEILPLPLERVMIPPPPDYGCYFDTSSEASTTDEEFEIESTLESSRRKRNEPEGLAEQIEDDLPPPLDQRDYIHVEDDDSAENEEQECLDQSDERGESNISYGSFNRCLLDCDPDRVMLPPPLEYSFTLGADDIESDSDELENDEQVLMTPGGAGENISEEINSGPVLQLPPAQDLLEEFMPKHVHADAKKFNVELMQLLKPDDFSYILLKANNTSGRAAYISESAAVFDRLSAMLQYCRTTFDEIRESLLAIEQFELTYDLEHDLRIDNLNLHILRLYSICELHPKVSFAQICEKVAHVNMLFMTKKIDSISERIHHAHTVSSTSRYISCYLDHMELIKRNVFLQSSTIINAYNEVVKDIEGNICTDEIFQTHYVYNHTSDGVRCLY